MNQITGGSAQYTELFDRGPFPTGWAPMDHHIERPEPTEPGTSNTNFKKRRRVALSVRASFLVGACFLLALPFGFFFGGPWIGGLLIPPTLGVYGLFLSSGKQLYVIDKGHYDVVEWNASNLQRADHA